jgi:hypothetical protein
VEWRRGEWRGGYEYENETRTRKCTTETSKRDIGSDSTSQGGRGDQLDWE